MFDLRLTGSVVEVRVTGEWPREEYLRACAEAAAVPHVRGVLFDLREMTNVPAPGRGAILAHEVPLLLPQRQVAFVVRLNTALYGVVRQITTLTQGELRLFHDRDSALEWLMEAPGTTDAEP